MRQPIVRGSRVRYTNAHLRNHRAAMVERDAGVVTELLPGRTSLRCLVLWEDSHTTWEPVGCLQHYSDSRLS